MARQRRATRRVWAVGVAALLAVGVLAPPARAEHTVTWGAGTECASASKQATTTLNQPVRMVVCVSLGGEPMPGWRMTLRVKGPERSVESQITTDDTGTARFSLQPTAAGTTTATLCDDDGCLYGDVVLTVTAAATTTTATTAPASVPPTVATDPTATTATTSQESPAPTTPSTRVPPEQNGDGGGGFPAWGWAGLVLLVLMLLAAKRGMLVMPVGGGVAAAAAAGDDDPCARYREEVRRREAERRQAETRRQQAEARARDAKAGLDRLRSRGVGGTADLESDVILAEADAEAAGEAVIRAADALQFARNDLARCERGEVMVAPEPAPAPGPGSTPGGGQEEPVPCCAQGTWIGVNVACGGQAVVVGREGGTVFLYCVTNPDRKAIILWQGTRWGPGLGGGASAGLFLVVNGPEHPNELGPVVTRILEGFDWDLSLGGSLSKIGRAGVTAVRQRRAFEMLRRLYSYANRCHDLKKARLVDDFPKVLELQREFGKVFKEFDGSGGLRELMNDKALEGMLKGGTSAGQAGGTGANIPIGVGIQVGAWKLVNVQTELFDVAGCPACDPSARR